ncbi:SNG1 family protein [Acidiferrimicrobium sp. IK]|uniref:SNG1 family protein n=1 Tax=Acidiferrimicrobium sp. IK TaxID=2871700 RepID=UPI0021CAFC8D|nr:SNG1 family protein [Acidiferrimicrobium sp. IK]MCU4183022.1 SNG1 family protein [Acidiferrimicrobium sp. IK]
MDTDTEPQSFWSEWRDAVEPRTVALIVGVLLLQMGFIASYVGAFHTPTPHRVPLAVVAPAPVTSGTVERLNGLRGHPLRASAVASRAEAAARVRAGSTAGAFVIDAQSRTDALLVSSGAGVAEAEALRAVITEVDASQQRTVTVTDLVPVQPGDGRGLTGFYLVIGWIVGGYLVASLLGVSRGSRPANPRRAAFRLMAVVPYAIVSGFGGALVVDQILGALTGHFVALWWLGALLVAASATVTTAFQVLFGVLGIGITVLVFVIIGNPTAGGAYQPDLLPTFWRVLAYTLPNGAGTDAVRRIVYFGSNGIGGHLAVIAAYAVGGAAVAMAASVRHHRRHQLLDI